MGEYTVWHIVLFAVFVFLWVYPQRRIIGKTGSNPAISFLAIFQALGLILSGGWGSHAGLPRAASGHGL